MADRCMLVDVTMNVAGADSLGTACSDQRGFYIRQLDGVKRKPRVEVALPGGTKAYADQAVRDHQALAAAARSGQAEAEAGL
ncbi:MAG TPA: hypothetical protein DDZ81_11150 [Acetobacteraceae bacterium]|nr:hypothetical protein [Acetobacteraceae bacterium]